MKPRINFAAFGIVDMELMRGFCERMGLVASSAGSPGLALLDANGHVPLP